LGGGRKVEPACAHIDLVPTLLAACGIAPPADRKLDGVDLLPVLRGDANGLSERTLFVQWHRGDVPEKYRAFAARGPRYKLVQPEHSQEKPWNGNTSYQLFDLLKDPF